MSVNRTAVHLLSDGLFGDTTSFVQTIQTEIGYNHAIPRKRIARIYLRGLFAERENLFKVAGCKVNEPEVVHGNRVTRVGGQVVLVGLDRFVDLSRNLVVIVCLNVKPLPLGSTIL